VAHKLDIALVFVPRLPMEHGAEICLVRSVVAVGSCEGGAIWGPGQPDGESGAGRCLVDTMGKRQVSKRRIAVPSTVLKCMCTAARRAAEKCRKEGAWTIVAVSWGILPPSITLFCMVRMDLENASIRTGKGTLEPRCPADF